MIEGLRARVASAVALAHPAIVEAALVEVEAQRQGDAQAKARLVAMAGCTYRLHMPAYVRAKQRWSYHRRWSDKATVSSAHARMYEAPCRECLACLARHKPWPTPEMLRHMARVRRSIAADDGPSYANADQN